MRDEPSAPLQGKAAATADFLAAELSRTQSALSTPILNRRHWDELREDRCLLIFLQARSESLTFPGVRVTLERMAEGEFRVTGIDALRTKAQACLRRWARDLDQLG